MARAVLPDHKWVQNNWFGVGARGAYARKDYFMVVLRFGWWQLWLEWDLDERGGEHG